MAARLRVPVRPLRTRHDHGQPGYAEVMARRHRIRKPKVVRNIPAPARWCRHPGGPRSRDPGNNHSLALYVGALTSGRGLETSIKAMALVPGARLKLLGPVATTTGPASWNWRAGKASPSASSSRGRSRHRELLDAISTASVGLALDPAGLPLLPDEPAEQAVRVCGRRCPGARQRPSRDRSPRQRTWDRFGR